MNIRSWRSFPSLKWQLDIWELAVPFWYGEEKAITDRWHVSCGIHWEQLSGPAPWRSAGNCQESIGGVACYLSSLIGPYSGFLGHCLISWEQAVIPIQCPHRTLKFLATRSPHTCNGETLTSTISYLISQDRLTTVIQSPNLGIGAQQKFISHPHLHELAGGLRSMQPFMGTRSSCVTDLHFLSAWSLIMGLLPIADRVS